MATDGQGRHVWGTPQPGHRVRFKLGGNAVPTPRPRALPGFRDHLHSPGNLDLDVRMA